MNVLKIVFSLFVVSGLFTDDVGAEDQASITLDSKTRNRCVEVLRSGMHGDDFWPSIHAAEGLTLGGHGDEVIAFLTPKQPLEKDDQQRCGIARELVRAGQPDQAAVMLEILAGKDPYGHVHAAESLYKVGIIGDGVAMRRAFAVKGNDKLKLMAAGALGRRGDPEAMAYLRESLADEDIEVVKIAAWVLGRIGNATDVPTMRKQLPRCNDAVIKAYVTHAMAALGDAEGLKVLAANLNSDDPAIRTYAATFAGDARALNLADPLKKMLNDPHPDAAIRAAQSLLMMAGPPTE